MRTKAPPLAPIFRSDLQARLLLHVLTATEPTTVAKLAAALGAPPATVFREARRLLDAGLLRGDRVGRTIRLEAAGDNPATAPLRQLLIVTVGPAHILEHALADVEGIEHAYVHGSWAARYHGEPGGSPGDIDLLIVGQPRRGAVDTALDGIETRLGREVNVTYVTLQRWHDRADPFIDEVRSRPLVELHPEHPEESTT